MNSPMMKWPMTESAKRALQQAGALARSVESPLIEPLHLLGALLLQESQAAAVLEQFGITRFTLTDDFPGFPGEDVPTEKARAVPADVFSAEKDEAGERTAERSVEELPPEEACSVALRSVLWEAAARFQRVPASVPGELGSEHLLWALTRVSSPAAQFLERHGLSGEALEARAAPPSEPLPVDFTINWQSGGGESERASNAGERASKAGERSNGTQNPGEQKAGAASSSPQTAPTERAAVFRLLDAAANRAREGLRVLEDHTRFQLNDSFLSGELKTSRHQLQEALQLLPARELLAARDTPGDIGTRIATDAEQSRHSLREVLQANFKRVQEALRSLEEFGKMVSPEFGRRCEALRYRFYTLEESVLRTTRAAERLREARLCLLLTRSLCRLSPEETLQQALVGGVDMVQIREKEMTDHALLQWSRTVRDITRQAGALLILNDRVDLAVLCEADGVHVGEDDLPPREARRLIGAERLLGVSTHTVEQLRRAVQQGADYLGVGPVFPSQTKDFADFAGLNYVREAAGQTALPWFAIGGIDADNLSAVVDAGAQRVAVSGAICRAENPADIARRLKEKLTQGKPV